VVDMQNFFLSEKVRFFCVSLVFDMFGFEGFDYLTYLHSSFLLYRHYHR